jgi:hypothetical protein
MRRLFAVCGRQSSQGTLDRDEALGKAHLVGEIDLVVEPDLVGADADGMERDETDQQNRDRAAGNRVREEPHAGVLAIRAW